MTSQTSCVMSSFGVRGLNTAGVSCGDTITVVSGRMNNTGISSSVESEPSSSGGVRGHPSGCGDEGDEVVDLSKFSIGLTSSIGPLSPGWVIAGTSTAGLSKASILSTSPLASHALHVVIRMRDLFVSGAIHFGVAKTVSSSSLDAVLLYVLFDALQTTPLLNRKKISTYMNRIVQVHQHSHPILSVSSTRRANLFTCSRW